VLCCVKCAVVWCVKCAVLWCVKCAVVCLSPEYGDAAKGVRNPFQRLRERDDAVMQATRKKKKEENACVDGAFVCLTNVLEVNVLMQFRGSPLLAKTRWTVPING